MVTEVVLVSGPQLSLYPHRKESSARRFWSVVLGWFCRHLSVSHLVRVFVLLLVGLVCALALSHRGTLERPLTDADVLDGVTR